MLLHQPIPTFSQAVVYRFLFASACQALLTASQTPWAPRRKSAFAPPDKLIDGRGVRRMNIESGPGGAKSW